MDSVSQPTPSAAPTPKQPVFADVVVPRRLATAFTYVIPDGLRARIRVGSRVRVPLGPTTVQGLIVSLSQTARWEGRRGTSGPSRPAFREIAELLDDEADGETDRRLLELATQVAEYYLVPIGQCLRLILPPVSKSRRRLLPVPDAPIEPSRQEGPRQAAAPCVTEETHPAWWPGFLDALGHPTHEAFLWIGPSVSRRGGLLEAVAALRADQRLRRSALILTPDLAKARMILEDLHARWPDTVVLLHGGLSAADSARAWRRIRAGEVQLVVGTRSAIFAPASRLGLIWVEDEHDELFKEEQAPHYHAREVAWMRARGESCLLVFGSASPSMETWRMFTQHATESGGSTTAPPVARPRPSVDLVDLRAYPPGTLLTAPLAAAIRDCLARRAGVLLFVNRKGFASALLCRDCGGSLSCPSCRVPLAYFRQTARLLCRFCGSTATLPETCPTCQSTKLELIGTGTERLEEHIRRLFPDARIARLDREAARTASRTDAIRRLFALGELDLLIGTKLLFTGPALPGLGLVGVIYADALLHRPDFRAAERTFHALSQAIEAAASGTEPGRVIIQTALPSHHAFAALATGELVRFYHQETLFRQALNYPPQARLVRLMAAAPQDHTARNLAERCAETIRRLSCTQEALRPVTLLGPTPASPSYLRKRYRWQLLVKAEDQAAASLIVRLSLEALGKIRRKNSEKLDVNVDPLEL